MAKKKSSALSFSIESGDQSTFDLFMKSPENIRDFTNWQDRTSSLEVDRARAFEKTPFDVNSDSFSTYDNIEIANDVAIASVPDIDICQVGYNINISAFFRVKVTISVVDGYNDLPGGNIQYGMPFFYIGTRARTSEFHFARCQENQGNPLVPISEKRELQFFVASNDYLDGSSNSGFAITNAIDLQPLERRLSVIQDAFAKASLEEGDLPPYYRGQTYRCNGVDSGIPLPADNPGIHVLAEDQGSSFLAFNMSGAREFGEDELGDGIVTATSEFTKSSSLGNTVAYKVELMRYDCKGFCYDKIRHEGAGRVDYFTRRSGYLTSADTANNTVTLDTTELQDGDLIKITSVLEPTPVSSINSLNGLHYVRKSGSSYELYSQANLTERLTVTDFRGITSSTWTLLKSVDNDSPTSNWAYSKSDCGINRCGTKVTQDQVLHTETTYDQITSTPGTNPNELIIRDKNFNLGKSIAISNTGAMAISQPASHLTVTYDETGVGRNRILFSTDYVVPASLGSRPEFGRNNTHSLSVLPALYLDVCEEEVDEATAPDDPTGSTYGGEGDIFDTPMSEPVVSTDGDNVDFYNYGDTDDDFSGSPDSSVPAGNFSGDSSLDKVYSIQTPYLFDTGEKINYGCVFIRDTLDSASRVITAATDNPFISSSPSVVPTYVDLYWHKVYAQNKGIFSDYNLVTNTIPHTFGSLSLRDNGEGEYEVFDIRILPDISTKWKFHGHPLSRSKVRATYLADFNNTEKYTDGFGIAIAFGEDGELYVADQTDHYGTAFSLFSDTLLFDYDHQQPRSFDPEYPYYSEGADFGLAQGELVTTKKQENLALQDFADNHTKTRRQMHEFSGQLFSVHIKLKNSTQVIPYNTADSVSIASDSDKVFISDGADIKVLTKESEISFGTKTANVINVARFTSFFDNGRYQSVRDALENPRIFPAPASMFDGHTLLSQDNSFAPSYDTYNSATSPLYKVSPFFGGLIQGSFETNLLASNAGGELRWIFDYFYKEGDPYDPFNYQNDATVAAIQNVPTSDTSQGSTKITYYTFSESYIPDAEPKFRVKDNILGFIKTTSIDEFGLYGGIAKRLVLYDTSKSRPEFLQRITAAVPGYGSVQDARYDLNEVINGDNSAPLDFSGFDIAGGKIFTSIVDNENDISTSGLTVTRLPEGRAYAIFTDTGMSPLPRSVPLGESTESVLPFFSFAEDFSDSSPYNLNDIYQYNRNEGSFISGSSFDINNSHRAPVVVFSVKEFTKNGQAIAIPIAVNFQVDVDSNTTFPDGNVVLPAIRLYADDPRLTIEQAGEVSGSDLVFGQDSSDFTPLYFGGVQNAKRFIITPTYRFTGGRYIGTASIDQSQRSDGLQAGGILSHYRPLSAADNRTLRYNDGNGNALTEELDAYGNRIPASYVLEFDDVNKDSYNASFKKGQKSLMVSLLSWSDEYRAERPRQGGFYDEDVEAYRKAYTKMNYNEENPHSYINNARVSVDVTYREYDLARVRRFACNGNWHLLENPNPDLLFNGPEISTLDLVRAGVGKSQPYLNESVEVLLGTESDSIQVVSPQLAFDTPKPDFLSLMISNVATENNDADLFTRGHIVSTGNVDLHISGVRLAYNFATLHLGEVKVDNDFDISIPEVIGFECDGISLALLPPTGTHEQATSSLVFPGATGVNEGLSLSVNPTYTSGAFDFYVQGGLGSGNMDVAISGVHGVSNSMPCVEGNLFIGAMTGPSSGIMPLHINRFTESGVMPLFMEPGNSSGVMPLSINTQPIHSSGTLFSRGHQSDDFETTLFIGRQFDEKRMDLSVSGPVEFNGDMTLHASGAVIPTANSLTNNYSHSCELLKTENKFDLSPSSEKLIPLTKANSISRNTHLPGSSFKYGYYSPLSPGNRLNNFTQSSANIFYDQELSREAVASNRSILAVGSNVSALSSDVQSLQIFEYIDGDSLDLKFTYDNFYEDMINLQVIGDNDSGMLIRYKSVDVSEYNTIAVSIRFRTANGLRDAVCILQPATLTATRYGKPTYDLCAIEPSFTIPSTTENIDGWIMTYAKVGDFINEDEAALKSNNYLGNTVQWKDLDLYYDKQSKNYGSVYYLQYSDNYATENLAFSFNSTSDGQGYYSNRYNIPEGTKVGFGSKFKIDGDYAVVSAPLFDSFIANNNLSVMHAPSPEGSAYVYRFDSEWIYVDAIYSGGYTSSDISGVSDCAYNYALFGYDVDLNKDSKYIAVSEPGTNTIYKYIIHDNDTVSSIDSYTDDTSARFGSSLNLCSNSILTNDIQFIKDPVHDYSFAFTPQENVQEVEQYNPSSSSTISVSSQFTFVKMIKPFGVPKLLAGRTFRVRFAAQPELIIEKISILDIRQNSGNLFISGPILSNSEQDLLYYRPFESGTNDMSLQFASIGVNSGIPLHVHVPDPASGDMSLHLRQAEKFETTLFIGAEFTDTTFASDLSISGPIASTLEKDLFAGGVEVEANDRDLYILGGLAAQRGQDMFIKQDDLISASGANELFLEGIYGGTGNIVKTSTLYLGAGNFGPASGISTLALKTDEFGRASGITTLAIAQDPASGVFDGTFAASVGGSGVSDTTGFFRENGTANLIIAATAPASGINTLYLHRKGIGGGEELDANSNLIVYNLTEASNVNLAVSGANIATADMNIAISGVVGLGTGIMPAFVRGYQD